MSKAWCSLARSPLLACFLPGPRAVGPAPAPSSIQSVSGSLVSSSSAPSSACLAGGLLSAASAVSAAHLNGPCVSVGPNAATETGVRRNGTTSGTGNVKPRSNETL